MKINRRQLIGRLITYAIWIAIGLLVNNMILSVTIMFILFNLFVFEDIRMRPLVKNRILFMQWLTIINMIIVHFIISY